MNNDKCESGNMSACQAAYEKRTADRLHHNVVLELDINREAWGVAIRGKVLNGYIQQLAVYPFTVVFYCEAQLLSYINYCCKNDSSTVHFDATGTVIKDIANQKRPLNYCLLMAEGSLPAMEFITTCHKWYYIKKPDRRIYTLKNGLVKLTK